MKPKRPNPHRLALLKALDRNGGYHYERKHFLLEWCLPVYTNKDFAALLNHTLTCPDLGNMNPAVARVWLAAYAEELGAVEKTFERWTNSPNNDTNEQMWDSFTDNDYYRRHPVSDKTFDCEWRLGGRGGKHLLLHKFEGNVMTGEAAELLGLDEDGDFADTKVTNEECRNLLDMIAFWNTTLTCAAVTKEYEYQLCDRIYREVEDRGMV